MIEITQIKYLFLLIFSIFIIGLSSCGSDDERSLDAGKYVGDVRDEKGGQVSVYIDLKNMQIDGQFRKFWIRYYGNKNVGETKESYMRQIGHWEVDCLDRTLYVLEEEYYSPEGKVLGRTDERKEEKYNEGALGDKLASAACRYGGRN